MLVLVSTCLPIFFAYQRLTLPCCGPFIACVSYLAGKHNHQRFGREDSSVIYFGVHIILSSTETWPWRPVRYTK